MRFVVIAVCSVVLFFPTYWLFEAVVGPNWGAGIAAVAMYIAFPILAMTVWPEKAPDIPQSMELALNNGSLASADFDVSESIEVQDGEDEEGRTYLMDVGNNRTLFVSGDYLYGVVESGRFPSTRIRLFWDERQNLTYGIQCLGDRLIPSQKIVRLPVEVLESGNYPDDRDVIGQRLHDVVKALSRNA